MSDRSTIILPEGNQQASWPSFPAVPYPMGGYGCNGNNNGWNTGMNSIADLFGLAIIASMFGWNGNGGFGGFGGGGNGAGYLANQLSNDSGRELIMNAVTAQGEASRTAIQSMSTMLGQDFNLVNSGVQNVQNALQTLALQQAVSVPQIINAIGSGDASIISAFNECCCKQQLLTVEQGYQSQLRTIEQTNTLGGAIADLKATMIDQFCQARERDMQSTIDQQADTINQLRNSASNATQTALFQNGFNILNQKLTELAAKQPQTVPVQWPQLTAVNTTPTYGAGFGNGFGWGFGNGFGNLVF